MYIFQKTFSPKIIIMYYMSLITLNQFFITFFNYQNFTFVEHIFELISVKYFLHL